MREPLNHVTDEQIESFCRRWKVTELSVFGSALRADSGPESDIDLLVTFASGAGWGLFALARMKQELVSPPGGASRGAGTRSGERQFSRTRGSCISRDRAYLLDMLDAFLTDLALMREAIRAGDGQTMFDLFTRTREIRRSIIAIGQDDARPDFGRADHQ